MFHHSEHILLRRQPDARVDVVLQPETKIPQVLTENIKLRGIINPCIAPSDTTFGITFSELEQLQNRLIKSDQTLQLEARRNIILNELLSLARQTLQGSSLRPSKTVSIT